MDGKVYKVPELVMGDILKVINALPYGQIAPLANALGEIIQKHDKEEKESSDGALKVKV